MEKSESIIGSDTLFKKFITDIVCQEIGRGIGEVTILNVHPDNILEDEEGWEIESFFPKGVEITVETLYDNLVIEEGDDRLAMGEIDRITYNGKIFVSAVNASPYIVFCSTEEK